MEDHDLSRYRPEYDIAITEDLINLGFIPDEGINLTDKKPTYYQSQKSERYQNILNDLIRSQKAYACECTRKDIQAAMEGMAHNEIFYHGKCREKKT
jgi:glutamyl/glutaminyl-tRNA synthetase